MRQIGMRTETHCQSEIQGGGRKAGSGGGGTHPKTNSDSGLPDALPQEEGGMGSSMQQGFGKGQPARPLTMILQLRLYATPSLST